LKVPPNQTTVRISHRTGLRFLRLDHPTPEKNVKCIVGGSLVALSLAACGASTAATSVSTPVPTVAPVVTPDLATVPAVPTDVPTPTPTPIDPAAYKASAVAISYNQLLKDPAALAGRVVTYTGQVFQYDTNTTTSHMIVAVTDGGYGYWSDNVWLDVDPATTANVCKDTVIRFWGDVVGPYTYTTTNNGSLTIPEIHVQFISATQKPC
jgi:hypothetical protein